MECAAYKCKSHSSNIKALDNNGRPLRFHRFPEDEKLKSTWIKTMRMENWQPSQDSHLCSKHFTSDSYVKHSIMLRKYAVPTIFEKYPDDVEQDEPEIKEEVDDITIEEEEFIAPAPITTVFPSAIVFPPPKTFSDEDAKSEVLILKRELSITKRRLNKMTELANRRHKKLKALQQQLRRKEIATSNGKGTATVLSIFKDYFLEFKSTK